MMGASKDQDSSTSRRGGCGAGTPRALSFIVCPSADTSAGLRAHLPAALAAAGEAFRAVVFSASRESDRAVVEIPDHRHGVILDRAPRPWDAELLAERIWFYTRLKALRFVIEAPWNPSDAYARIADAVGLLAPLAHDEGLAIDLIVPAAIGPLVREPLLGALKRGAEWEIRSFPLKAPAAGEEFRLEG